MDVGSISQLPKLSYDDMLLMIDLMPKYSETLTLLLDVFQSEEAFLKFIDLFAGREIKLPPRTKLFHTINNIHMYNYYNKKVAEGVSRPDLDTAHMFDVTTQRVIDVVERINKS